MIVAISGAGATGARAARFLVDAGVEVAFSGGSDESVQRLARALGRNASAAPASTGAAVILASPAGCHVAEAREHLAAGRPVISVSDDPDDIEELLSLDAEARERGTNVVVGAGMSPGLSCVLASLGASRFEHVDEIHVARVGAGGPSCALRHHEALSGTACDWRDGGWLERPAGSGRELCWFPDPVGPRDCYRAGLGDALLLVRAFPGVDRVTARLAASRADRVTSRMPMLRKPPEEGGPGAIRVEVRGRHADGATGVEVFGALDRPSVAAGAVAALAARAAVTGALKRHGAAGLAELVDPGPFLTDLAEVGVKSAVFEGSH